jgi:hypothetical protein
MKKLDTKIIAGLAAVTAIGILLLLTSKQKKKKRLKKIAEEGYETASDILFPNKSNPSKKLHFGPVLPE